jgi:hypothetical protein
MLQRREGAKGCFFDMPTQWRAETRSKKARKDAESAKNCLLDVCLPQRHKGAKDFWFFVSGFSCWVRDQAACMSYPEAELLCKDNPGNFAFGSE